MNSVIVLALLGMVAYASAGAIVSPVGLAYGAHLGYAGTDLTGAIGIAQGRQADYLGKVADAQGKYADYLGKVSDAQAKAVNFANKGYYAAAPIAGHYAAAPIAGHYAAHAGLYAAPAAYGYGLGSLGYAHAPLIL